MWHRRHEALASHNYTIRSARTIARFAFVAATMLSSYLHAAQVESAFAGGVTPSRFELRAAAGDVVRQTLKIYNLGARPQQFNVRTVDWRYTEAGQISFQNELAPDSCREWVRLERRRINVVPDPQRPRNFRFEMHIPDAQPDRECRFAIMVESLAAGFEASFGDGALSLPISGRIAVIVYLGVGDVAPELQIGEIVLLDAEDGALPAVAVRNLGSAHGRVDAELDAIASDGKRTRLSIATSPILPGQTRYLKLTPETRAPLNLPARVRGRIYTDREAFEVDQALSALPEHD